MDWFAAAIGVIVFSVFARLTVHWLRTGAAQQRDVALGLAPLVVLDVLSIDGMPTSRPVLVIIILAFVAMPILFLRMVRHIRPMPMAIYGASMMLFIAALMMPRLAGPQALVLANALFMGAVVAPYVLAAGILLAEARVRPTISRPRLTWVAANALAMVVILLFVTFQGGRMPGGTTGLALQGAFAWTFIWAFATPRHVRQAWQAIAYKQFIEAIDADQEDTLDDRMGKLRDAAADVIDAEDAFSIRRDGHEVLAAPDEPVLDAAEAKRLMMDDVELPGWLIVRFDALGGPRRALAFKRRSDRLFPGDDAAMFETIRPELQARFRAAAAQQMQRDGKVAAQELADFRSDYLRSVAHELANPLSPVKIHVALLKDRFGEEAPRSFAQIDASIGRVESLIRDIAAMARIDMANTPLRLEPLSARHILDDAVGAANELAQASGCTLHVVADDGLGLNADRRRVGQMLDNLISNAIKYSPGGGDITITAAARDEEVHIAVRDEGLGMTAEQVARLFGTYARLHTDLADHIPGTGLGLYISKQMARLHGGDLVASSPGPGLGSRFTLVLPQAGPANPPGARTDRPPMRQAQEQALARRP